MASPMPPWFPSVSRMVPASSANSTFTKFVETTMSSLRLEYGVSIKPSSLRSETESVSGTGKRAPNFSIYLLLVFPSFILVSSY